MRFVDPGSAGRNLVGLVEQRPVEWRLSALHRGHGSEYVVDSTGLSVGSAIIRVGWLHDLGPFASECLPLGGGLMGVAERIEVEASGTDSGGRGRPGSPGQAPPITLPAHGLVRYSHARLAVTDGAVRWEVPRTVLGVIPIGVRRLVVPVGDVRSLTVGRAVRPFRLLVGVALMVAPWFLIPWWMALLLLSFGLWVALVSLGPQLQLVTRSGNRHRAAVCFGHQIDAELYIAAVTDLAGS